MEKQVGTLIKVLPIKRKINDNTNYDSILLWYRDSNGIKRTQYVERAEVPFYIIRDKMSEEAITPPMFIQRDKVDKIMVYSDMLYREIALRTDSMAYYDHVMLSGRANSSNLKNLLKHNLIYDADMDVSDRYIKNFHEQFEPDINYKLHKCYMDIEVDLMPDGFKKDAKGNIGYMGFPEEDIAPCPVNIITLIDAKSLIVHSFTYRNPLNKSQQDFEAHVNEHIANFKAKLFDEDLIMFNDIQINFYNSEEEMIEAFFRKVHEIDPDIVGSWNQVFDVQTLLNRLTHLYDRKKKETGLRGFDKMLLTVCDQKYMNVVNKHGEEVYLSPKAFYKAQKDKSVVDRFDYFTVLDGIVWIDQMLLFANIRKGAMRESYSLDAISNEELGKEKLDYTGYTIKNLPWKNFAKFVLYNIQDVNLLMLLENKNLDCELLQRLSDITNTRKEKVFKKTISLKNFVCKFAEEQGFVMSNNKNAQYGNDDGYFEAHYLSSKPLNEADPTYRDAFDKKDNFGAYVGDPLLNDNCGIKDASGKPSMFIYENVFDEDFSSLYPSIIRAYNLDKNTQLGKFFMLDNDIKEKLIGKYGYDGLFAASKNEEAEGTESSSDMAPTLVDSLVSHNWSRIGEKFFDLPSTTDIIKGLKERKG